MANNILNVGFPIAGLDTLSNLYVLIVLSGP